MKDYNFKEIEPKWQKIWEEQNLFKTYNKVDGKENYYVLTMLPYPSGKLHVGHARNYTLGDVVARYKRMRGYNVLNPMGWDSFGLPAENAAIQNNARPDIWTEKNIANMKRQLKLLGFSYDWDREIATYKPEYYRWNQWMFKRFYEKGLIYKKKSLVNWCPDCNTVLANEQVEDGKCWRHSKTNVEQKELEQWFFKITDYADELLKGLNELKGGWPDKVLAMQKNWIGKSYGVEINFEIVQTGEILPMFTTRIDTIYGVSYCVIAPEHPLVEEIIKTNPSIKDKVLAMKNTDLIERSAEGREKQGVATGWEVINPITKERVPLWIADYVLMNYGTGAVMAVPCHDERDFAFANKYNLPKKVVINGMEKNKKTKEINEIVLTADMEKPYTEIGIMTNSDKFNGLTSEEALTKIADYVEELGVGHRTVKYRLKDWGISRQRYWGTPIPVLYCDNCGVVLEDDKNLPVKLPNDVNFDGIGNPLATSKSFANATCPKCGGHAHRDTDTMDTFYDSSWYFLRYCDPHNTNLPFDKNIVNEWMGVNQYIGGVEHAVMHLLYARFFEKILRDSDMVSADEPFKRLLTQGMVLGPSYYSEKERRFVFARDVDVKGEKAFLKTTGEELVIKVEKMSKSKNNGVDPEEMVQKYGADTTRLFIMFAAPPEKELEWNENGLAGAYRFLNKIWRLVLENKDNTQNAPIDYSKISKDDKKLVIKLNQTIKKVSDSIEDNYHFNTAIASTMELINATTDYKNNILDKNLGSSESKKIFDLVLSDILIMLSPFVPHITDELWGELGHNNDIYNEKWPEYKKEYLESSEVGVAVQVNGKLRGTIEIDRDMPKDEVEKIALGIENVQKYIEGKNIVKVIVIPNKIVNIVVK